MTAEVSNLDVLAARVRRMLAQAHADWRGDLVLTGRGLEAAVFRTVLPPFGEVVVKAPWRRFPGGTYGSDIDCRALLRQERVLAAWAAGIGIPAPTPFALHESEDQDILVSTYVEGDGGPPAAAAFAALLRTLHAAPPPDVVPVAHGPSGHFPTQLADRIRQRLDRLAALTGATLPLLGVDALRSAVPDTPRVLLHMDLRPVNLRCRDGRIAAVFDWSNAVIGDPAFELARMHEAGTLTDDMLDAYGRRDWSAHLPARTRIAYHLDAALLLAIVFLVGEPDPVRASRMSGRVRALLDEWRRS